MVKMSMYWTVGFLSWLAGMGCIVLGEPRLAIPVSFLVMVFWVRFWHKRG